MGFAEGFAAGSSGLRGALQMAFDKERADKDYTLREAAERRAAEEFGWRRTDRNNETAAVGSMTALQQGVYPGGETDFSVTSPEAEFGPVPQERQLGIVPRGVPRKASSVEMNEAAQRVALARRDLNAWQNLDDRNVKLTLEKGRRDQFKQYSSMKPEELASTLGGVFSDDPETPAMLDFDPKSRKFLLVSKVPGIPTQSLSKDELVQHAMGIWEAGNGDYNAGMSAILATVKTKRELADRAYTRSGDIAKANADVHFKGLSADNDATRTGNDTKRLGLEAQRLADARARGAAQDAREKILGPTKEMLDKDGNTVTVYAVAGKNGVEWREMAHDPRLRPMKPPPVLNDLEKITYEKVVVPQLEALNAKHKGAEIPTPERAAVFRNAGLDPARFGVQGMPGWGQGPRPGKPTPAAAPAPALQPPRRHEGQRFGMFTPRSVIDEAVRAGNPDAIAFQRAMEENARQSQNSNLGLIVP